MKKSIIASVLAISATFSVQAKDIVDTAVAAGSFKTLATALIDFFMMNSKLLRIKTS